MNVTGLAGGVGGAKLLVGLQRALYPGALTAVVNTGDDASMYGVHVSPDVDIVTYRLAWFGLGDRDLATCLFRSERLAAGVPLSEVAEEIRRALGVPTRIIPMSDDEVRTKISLVDGRTLDFQTYFVKERHEPPVSEVFFRGIESAVAAPGVLDAIASADAVLICPSNPILSVGPILGLPGVRETLRSHPRVVAVTPIVGGAALKGPADRMLADLGSESSASGVASLYTGICDAFVVDSSDPQEADKVASLDMVPVLADTIMHTDDDSLRLAEEILGWS
jgi:LPPG:FO 2-phospho-L-lactate transferase